MGHLSPRSRRRGYSLLELLLALGIGTMLLIALYTAMNLYFKAAATGRTLADQSNTVSAIIEKINKDLGCALSPVDPLPQTPPMSTDGTSGTPTTGTPAASTPATSGTTAGATASAQTTGGTTAGGTTTDDSVTAGDSNSKFNWGVVGYADRLTIFTSKVPGEALKTLADPTIDTSGQFPSDLRRITYWMVNDGGNASGLARQEVKWVTSDQEAANLPPDVQNPQNYIFASEVKEITFEYFDGNGWVDTWDGRELGADGMNPKGPPSAIRMTMTLEFPHPQDATQKTTLKLQHAIALPTANILTPDNANNQLMQQNQQQQQQQQQMQQPKQ